LVFPKRAGTHRFGSRPAPLKQPDALTHA
jgi:hypothetical protein